MNVRLKIATAQQAEELRAGTLYEVQANGVLTVVLQKGKVDFRVLREFSPAGWESVSGRRFQPDTNNLDPAEDGDDYLFEPYDVRDSIY